MVAMPMAPSSSERRRRADEAVDAMRGIDGAEQREGAGRRQNAGHIGAGGALDRHPEAGAADEFAGRDQNAMPSKPAMVSRTPGPKMPASIE